MAQYSYLTFKSGHDPSELERNVIDTIESRFVCPIAWLALFRENQIDAKNYIAVSSSAISSQTIAERSNNLLLAIGQDWQQGIDQFIKRLDASMFVELNLQDWFHEPSEFEGYMNLELSTFSEPFYTEEKHFLSRKPKINKEWKQHIIEEYPRVGVFE